MPWAARVLLIVAVALTASGVPVRAADVPAVPVSPATPWLTAAVADFVDAVSYPRHRAGWRAAEWTQVLLVKAARWQMISRDKVALAASGLPAPGPLPQTSDLQRLADAAGAGLLVIGVLRAVALDQPSGSVAVDLHLEVLEASTGETVMASSGKGAARADRANPLPTDVLVEDALHKACEAAVAALVAPRPASGTVLARTGDKELLIGLPAGFFVRASTRLLIVRADGGTKTVLAVAEIRKVTGDRASALVVSQTAAPRLDDIALFP
jgi:hypothetical protein